MTVIVVVKGQRKHGLVTQENRFRLRETPHQAPADWFRTMAWPSGPQSRPWSATGPSRGRQPARALARGHGDRPVGPPAQDGAPPPPALNARRRTPREIAGASLLIPGQRPIPQHLGQPQPLRLPPIKDRPHDVGRKAGERQQPTDVGDGHARLLCEVGDRLRSRSSAASGARGRGAMRVYRGAALPAPRLHLPAR